MLNFEFGYTPTNLRLAIEKLGLTQAAFAKSLSVSEKSVRNWLMPVGTNELSRRAAVKHKPRSCREARSA